jgi:hypothetical protein
MNKKEKPKRKSNEPLNVEKVMEDFQREEESSSHRNGTFKIEAQFEDALETIMRAKPTPQKPRAK